MLEDFKHEQGLLNLFTKELSPVPSKSRGEGERVEGWDADADTAGVIVNGRPGEHAVFGRAQILKSTLHSDFCWEHTTALTCQNVSCRQRSA